MLKIILLRFVLVELGRDVWVSLFQTKNLNKKSIYLLFRKFVKNSETQTKNKSVDAVLIKIRKKFIEVQNGPA